MECSIAPLEKKDFKVLQEAKTPIYSNWENAPIIP